MLGTQFQQRGEEPDTFKARVAHVTDSACWRVTGLSFFLQVHFQSQSKQCLCSLQKSIVVCVCVCLNSPQMLASSQLGGLVADAPCVCRLRCSRGRAGEDVHIRGDTLMYTYMYMCTCLCVSSTKTAVHLVGLVCTLIWLNKTFVLPSTWNQGIDKDSVCGSSAVVVDLLRPEEILH